MLPNHQKLEKLLILIILAVLTGTPFLHKVLGQFPPDWFIGKFDKSLIALVPGGVTLSFVIITLLEASIALCSLMAILRKEFMEEGSQRFSALLFNLTLILFIILLFGSFLVQDYNNGFRDFLYFSAIIYLRKVYFAQAQVE